MEQKNRSSFCKFLEHILSSREVSLAIAQDDKMIEELMDLASAHGLIQCEDAYDMVRKIGEPTYDLFIVLRKELPKPLYDLTAQYPTGQIQLNAPDTLEPIIVHPNYEKNTVLIIATQKIISTAQAAGFNLLQRVGLCWQPLP